MNETRLESLPMVLETPIDKDGKENKGIWAGEIKMLESLIGMDPQSQEFLAKEKALASEGEAERAKYQEAYDKKLQKEQKQRIAAEKRRKGQTGKRKKAATDEIVEDEISSDGNGSASA